MKLSPDKLKQIIKEELTKMMEESGEPQVVSQQQDKVRLVKLSVGGKQVEISFSSSGGSPLVSKSFYDELSDAEQSEVMQKAQAAAGIKGMEDYSEDEMQRMMGGEEISGFKPMKEEELEEAYNTDLTGRRIRGGDDEKFIPGSGIKNLPPPGPLSKSKSEPSRSGPPPIADKLFTIASELNQKEDKFGPLMMMFGNLVSSLERGSSLTDHDLNRITQIVSDLKKK